MPYRITENCMGCGHCVQWCPTKAIKGRRKLGYQIDPALCVDCGACGRICTVEAVLCPDGRTAVHLNRSQWNRPRWVIDACTRCNLCIPACPVKCIRIADRDDQEGAMVAGYPYLSRSRMCIGCGFCGQACLENAIQLKPVEVVKPQTVMA